MSTPSPTGTHSVTVSRYRAGRLTKQPDRVAVEEPCALRLLVDGRPRTVAITMRTPGRDRELMAGFLFTEGLLPAGTSLTFTEPLDEVGDKENLLSGKKPEEENKFSDVRAGDGARVQGSYILASVPATTSIDLPRLERHSYTSSSCGVCGKTSLALVHQSVPWAESPRNWSVEPAVLTALPDRLRAAQTLFEETGGIHAVGLFTPGGELLHFAEDVGRHNALDKLIGHYFQRDELPLDRHILLLSGRSSFELIQKAAMAGIRAVAAVGAPSSLAVELAREEGIWLAGFLRGERFNVYAE